MKKKLIENARQPAGFWGGLKIRSMNKRHAELSRWGLSLLPESDYADAADVGCGGGSNVRRLADICSGALFGIDPSPLCLKKSERKCAALVKKNRARFFRGTADVLPFPDDCLSLVTAFETVYFWRSLPENFAEIFRALKSGGVFLIVNELTEDDPEKYRRLKEILPLMIFTESELTAALRQAGFTRISAHRKGDWLAISAAKP